MKLPPSNYYFKTFSLKTGGLSYIIGPQYGVPHGILQVFIIILYENVLQNHFLNSYFRHWPILCLK
jgi:hypothetical protein